MAEDLHCEFELEEGLDQELENILNHPAPAYGEIDYWNNRYHERPGEQFEWFQPWGDLKSNLSKYLPVSRGSALVVGCGNSAMSIDLLPSYNRVFSIDISDEVINQMKEKYRTEGRLEWATMDCTKMSYPNNFFDAVIDKGTLDTLMCYDNSSQITERTVKEIARVLKPNGFFFLISYGIPKTRKKYFDKVNGFSILETISVEKPGFTTSHFIYVMKLTD
jgi:ubiquinone/menaquinone biosynthesis C-methylase UbiE